MIHKEELNNIFGGPGTINKLLEHVKKGIIKQNHVETLADGMGNGVRPVFDQCISDKDPIEVAVGKMMDEYFEGFFYRFKENPFEGQKSFKHLLEESSLTAFSVNEITKEFVQEDKMNKAEATPIEYEEGSLERKEGKCEQNVGESARKMKKPSEDDGLGNEFLLTTDITGNGRKKVLIIGKTGVGKSSLCNVIGGRAHDDQLFPVSAKSKSCTQQTKERVQNIL